MGNICCAKEKKNDMTESQKQIPQTQKKKAQPFKYDENLIIKNEQHYKEKYQEINQRISLPNFNIPDQSERQKTYEKQISLRLSDLEKLSDVQSNNYVEWSFEDGQLVTKEQPRKRFFELKKMLEETQNNKSKSERSSEIKHFDRASGPRRQFSGEKKRILFQ